MADLYIFHNNCEFHRLFSRNKGAEVVARDDGILNDKYPNQLAILVDKGCQGAAEFFRVLHSRKKSGTSFVTD